MRLKVFKNTVLFFVVIVISCGYKSKDLSLDQDNLAISVKKDSTVIVGANRLDLYIPLLKGKRVGVVGNQSSVIFKDLEHNSYTHLIDSLLQLKINVVDVFSPEHGFRGKADAGEVIKDGFDPKTGLPIISLYGDDKKPRLEKLVGKEELEREVEEGVSTIDIMICDLQDVGARFYTYISTLHYVMEACAEQNIPLIILDRPNPNGHYVDGPILEMEHSSFVGMHPVPIVHGMTIGEYAQMINGEGWLKNSIQCNITIVPVENYTHQTVYSLPIKPSPNLPNDTAINLYPSLCFFEGTNVSVGRGTDLQFQIIGSPFYDKAKTDFNFTPLPNEGAKYPMHEGKVCYGYNLTDTERVSAINLEWLIQFYEDSKEKGESDNFFNKFFVKLAGTEHLKNQIENGWTSARIKTSWAEGLNDYIKLRKKYLLYDE